MKKKISWKKKTINGEQKWQLIIITFLLNLYPTLTYLFSGERCEVLANECLNNPCATPLICMPINTTPGYTCKCPDGFSTTTCGVDATDQCLDGSEGRDQGPCYTPRSPLSFSGKSYAQYSLATSIDKKLIVSLRLRTVQLTGNIMFLAGRVDYSILEVWFWLYCFIYLTLGMVYN